MYKVLLFLSGGVIGGVLGALGTIVLFSYGFTLGIDNSNDWGQFPVDAQVKFLKDGRSVQLLKDFAYIDPSGRIWKAPKGLTVDGASIPQPFFSITGGPYSDKFRDASIIHDEACKSKKEPWNEVHKMFYNACRCGGLPKEKAKLFFLAVYQRGPRWGENQESRWTDYLKLITEYEKDLPSNRAFDLVRGNIDKGFIEKTEEMDFAQEKSRDGFGIRLVDLHLDDNLLLINGDQKKQPVDFSKEEVDALEKFITEEDPSLDELMKIDLNKFFSEKKLNLKKNN